MSKVVTAPNNVPEGLRVFLAGTIDNGDSEDWQSSITSTIQTEGVVFINPRRDDWDKSWDPVASNPKFHEQVTWELSNIEDSDIVFMYFAPGSLSPISLLELGLCVADDPIVVVPDGYFRKGNIEIVLDRYQLSPLYHTMEDGITALNTRIEDLLNERL